MRLTLIIASNTCRPRRCALRLQYNCSCCCCAFGTQLTCLQVVKIARQHPFVQCGIPVVLDGIVSAPRQLPRQHGPLVAYLCMEHDQLLILLMGPFAAVDVGVKMVVPPAISSTQEVAAAAVHTTFQT
jgi:hypothetical protein